MSVASVAPQRFVALDLEFNKLVPSSASASASASAAASASAMPQIACAALVTSDGSYVFWHGGLAAGGGLRESMSSAQVHQLVEHLFRLLTDGFTIVTWGGTASDFRVLFNECTTTRHRWMVTQIAWAHVDVPLLAAAAMGCMMGLDAVADAMGLAGKTFASTDVPSLWARPSEQARVLQHVRNDAELTAHIYAKMFDHAMLWTTRSGLHTKSPLLKWRTRAGGLKHFYAPFLFEPLASTTTRRVQGRLLNVYEASTRLPKPTTPFEPVEAMTVGGCTAWLLAATALVTDALALEPKDGGHDSSRGHEPCSSSASMMSLGGSKTIAVSDVFAAGGGGGGGGASDETPSSLSLSSEEKDEARV